MGDNGIVSFGCEVDLDSAIEYFGDKCIIAGNIDPMVILTGTPQEVYELSKRCIEKGGNSPGGYILTAGCDIPPIAPPYSIYVMSKAVSDADWYD